MIEQERLLLNPFPGLRAFRFQECDLFFGRDGQSDQVLTKLRTARFVAVVGTSGSGKSSLVSAGLLPALFSGHMPSAGSSWRIASFRPGSSPIWNLAEALSAPDVCGAKDEAAAGDRLENIERTLRRSSLGLLEVVSQSKLTAGENLLILADQFEELFRFRKKSTAEHPEDEAAAFVKLLLEAKQADKSAAEKLPIYVILTMRSDYLGDCAHFWGLPEAINEGQFLIPRMTDDNRREAITGPVIMGGGEITAPLVNRLLNDAGDDPAQLPILQHALMRTWEYWKNSAHAAGPIDIPHYQAIGGMSEALSNHADEAFWNLSPQLQEVASKVFKSLTEKEADNREGRRPATIGEIAAAAEASEEQVRTVIESFRREDRSFLMPPPPEELTSDTLIDISHESLIRGWVRLRAWVDEEAEAARQYIGLADRAALFPENEDFLSGPALGNGLNWLADNRPTKVWAERYHPGFAKTIEYLERSKANRKHKIAVKEWEHKEKVKRDLRHTEAIAGEQRRRVKQLRWGLALLSLLLIGMFSATVYAFTQRDRAKKALKDVVVERDNAKNSEEEARKQRSIAVNALDGVARERDRAEVAKSEAAEQRDAAQRERAEAERQSAVAKAATIEADRQKQVAEKALGTAQTEARKARTAETVALKAQKDAEAQSIEAKRQRDTAAELLRTVTEIDSSAPYFRAIMRGHTDEVRQVSFSPDGKLVITSTELGSRVWDASTGLPRDILPPKYSTKTPEYVAMSNSGKLLFLADSDEVEIVDVEGKQQVSLLEIGGKATSPVKFSPDDRLIATGIRLTNEIALSDVSTGKSLVRLKGHTGQINDIVFSSDGRTLATASDDASVRLWDVATGRERGILRGHLKGVSKVTFDSEAKILVTVSKEDGTALVWDASTGETLTQLLGFGGKPVLSAVFSRDGRYILTTSGSSAFLWEAKTPGNWKELSDNSPTALKGHALDVTEGVFGPDGKRIVTISEDRTARVWEAKSASANAPATSIATLAGHIKPLLSVAFSPDSRYVVTGSDDKTARVWDLTGLGAFSATSALKAEPSTYTGKCPLTLKFTGTITAAGGSGTVKYKFVRSDGTTSLPQELTFDGPGEQEVSTTREMYFKGVSRSGKPISQEGWLEIEILEPAAMKSNRATFTVVCDDPGEQQVALSDVTEKQLAQIMPASTIENRQRYLPYLQTAMEEFGINTPLRRAEFLAEIALETEELKVLEERVSGEQYEGRKYLGNTQPGDGRRYKGRGGFQTTGKSNYQKFGQQLGIDLIAQPELTASPEVAFRLAGLVWQSLGLNELADKGSTTAIRRRIYGGLDRLNDVLAYSKRAREALGVVSTQ